jgi:hypothetical protein
MRRANRRNARALTPAIRAGKIRKIMRGIARNAHLADRSAETPVNNRKS